MFWLCNKYFVEVLRRWGIGEANSSEFGLIENLAMTVLQASGLPVGKNKTVKKANEKVETDFQKAWVKSGEKIKKEI